MQDQYESLAQILHKLKQSKKGRLIIDDSLSTISLNYQELEIILRDLKNNYFDKHFDSNKLKLFAVITKNWNKEFYVILLSIIYTENAFIVIDTEWPDNYILSVISNTHPNYIIYDNELEQAKKIEQLLNNREKDQSRVNNSNKFLDSFAFRLLPYMPKHEQHKDLAYVISTSGTTGAPKIIHVLNSCIIPNITQLSEIFKIDEDDVVYQASPMTFDPSIVEIFCALYSDASILILPQAFKLVPKKWSSFLKKHNVTVLQLIPTLFENIKDMISENLKMKSLILGGESFPKNSIILKKFIESGINVFNIYGITEMSCWSSFYSVTGKDMDENEDICIGKPLKETQFYFKNDCHKDSSIIEITEQILSNSYHEKYQGILYHSSQTRISLINGKREKIINSADTVSISNGKIYIRGRSDNSIKINGILTDLTKLEMLCKNFKWIKDSHAVVHENNQLILIVQLVETVMSTNTLDHELREHIKTYCPYYYEPQRILFLNDQYLPMTSRGKIDTDKLLELYLKNKNSKDKKVNRLAKVNSIKNLLTTAWKEVLNFEPTKEDVFIESGGNSLKALMFIDIIETELDQLHPNLKPKNLLDVLLTKTFQDLIEYLNNEIATLIGHLEDDNFVEIKRPKIDKLIHQNTIEEENQLQWRSKLQSNSDLFTNKTIKSEQLNLIVAINWKYDTNKCVDATPLYVELDNKSYILVGSHSAEFFCLNPFGKLLWSFKTEDRIESSAIISKCGLFVIFGSYDFNVYILRLKDGGLEFKIKTGDIVKSSPCLNKKNGHIYVGSYDKHLYCISIEDRKILWKIKLDGSSIFSGPVQSKSDIFVTTLGGCLFSIDMAGSINWKLVLDKPIFASAALNENTSNLFVGTVSGCFYCVQFDKKLKWKFQTDCSIFDTACLIESYIVFGSNDQYLYCLDQETGILAWKCQMKSQIYSSPSVMNISGTLSIICICSNGILNILKMNGEVLISKDLFELKNCCFSSPIIIRDQIYIGCRDNCLYSIEILSNKLI